MLAAEKVPMEWNDPQIGGQTIVFPTDKEKASTKLVS
jgi:hypothetical protein